MWMFRYFEDELGIPTYRTPIVREIGGKVFFIGHGDGLGPGDRGYKFLKKVFANRVCQWLFERIHPNLGVGMAKFWSGTSRKSQKTDDIYRFLGEDREWLLLYANRKLDTVSADYFVFGHRHLPIDRLLKDGKSRYVNLGEWLTFNSYGVFDGKEMTLRFFENEEGRVF